MRLNILHLLSLRQGREIGTTIGLTTSAAAARRMPPPPFLDMTRRIPVPEAVVAPPREQLFDQCDPRYSVGVAENSKIEDTTTAAAGAAGGWVCGETINGNTSKVEREGLDNDDQALIKRRRVVSSSTPLSLASSFVELRERLSALVNDPQSPTTIVSMTDRRRIRKPSSTYYQRGVQW